MYSFPQRGHDGTPKKDSGQAVALRGNLFVGQAARLPLFIDEAGGPPALQLRYGNDSHA
jgi:hypothetical protein